MNNLKLDWCQAYGVTDIGKVRPKNEDSFLLEKWENEDAILAVVADGMGGKKAGDLASKLAVDSFQELLKNPLPLDPSQQYDLLLEQCYHADEKIREEACQSFKTLGMGSTVVAAIITPTTCVHVYVGDSRLYHFREGILQYKTKDHSLVSVLLEIGKITEEEIPTHPMRSILSSCLGGQEREGNFSISPKSEEQAVIQLEKEDLILLSSDGLHGLLSSQELENIVKENQQNQQYLTDKLVETALENGGKDNITLLSVGICFTEKIPISLDSCL